MNFRRTLMLCTVNLILLTFFTGNGLTYTQTVPQPNPVLVFTGGEPF
ncbi:MAG TPA: hypothetical protein VEW46_20755 [Pyrinomonadaceae bacterium]|nr:hypothetical protein [Pyrinomonadaceae bacterium]